MNRITLLVLVLIISAGGNAQPKNIEPAGINFENITYPFPVHYMNTLVQWEQLKMAYMDVQPEKPNGRNILLLHGKNFNGAYWETTAKELRKRGYHIIIPDQVGFGKSSKPKHIQYSFQLLAQQTKTILDSLKIGKTIVLGHSMGGMLAIRFTLMYPELVEKLILEDPIGLEDWKLKVPYQSVENWYKSELRQDYNSIKKYQQENYYHGTWKPEYEKWVTLLARWTMNPDYPVIAWNAALTYDMIYTQPVLYEFDQLQIPTLLIIGELDRTALGKNLVSDEVKNTLGNYPQLAKEASEKIKTSKLVQLPRTGHLPHIESFDAFIKSVLSFLAE